MEREYLCSVDFDGVIREGLLEYDEEMDIFYLVDDMQLFGIEIPNNTVIGLSTPVKHGEFNVFYRYVCTGITSFDSEDSVDIK